MRVNIEVIVTETKREDCEYIYDYIIDLGITQCKFSLNHFNSTVAAPTNKQCEYFFMIDARKYFSYINLLKRLDYSIYFSIHDRVKVINEERSIKEIERLEQSIVNNKGYIKSIESDNFAMGEYGYLFGVRERLNDVPLSSELKTIMKSHFERNIATSESMLLKIKNTINTDQW